MVDSPTTRHLLRALLLVALMGFLLGDASKDAAATEADAKWMAPLKQYGYTAKHLRNKVEHGEFTTFELGSPNYKILNPEDEPEYITADQPHYQEMLRRLTSPQSGSDTIDVDMAVRSQSQREVTPEQGTTQIPHRVKEAAVKQLHIRVKEAVKQIPVRIKVEMHHPRPYLAPSRWEKLNRKRSSLEGRPKRKEAMPEAREELSLFPEFEVYQGARPFQRSVANLN